MDAIETEPHRPASAGQPTLGDLVQQLGAEILEVVAAPAGLDVPIAHPVVHDPQDELVADVGDLILVVGASPGSPSFAPVVKRAGELDAAAVIAKFRADDGGGAAELARGAGIALLSLTPEMGWGQLHTLLRTSLVRAGASTEPLVGGVAVGDLFALANAVAAMVGGAVTVEDPQSRVLAYSNMDTPVDEPRRDTILGRRVPRNWIDQLSEHGVFRRLWSSDDVVEVADLPSPPGEPPIRKRLAIAVRAGDEIVGSIWVSEGDEPFSPEAPAALRQAAELAALHMVRHRSGEDLERKMRADLLRSLLEGRASLNLVADRLGLEADGRYCVVAFDALAGDDAEIALQRERTLQLVAMHCEAFRRRAVQTTIGRVVYALLPLPEDAGEDGARQLVEAIVERGSEVLSVGLRAAIGRPVEHLRAVTDSWTSADQVLRVLDNQGADAPRVASFEDVRATALLLELRDVAEERPQLREGKLQLLVEHDREHGSDYVESLRAYLRTFGDVPTAAQQVSVHPNTFRYRLKRLCEISGLDLDDPDERLITELQLLLL